jgi:hypothetical protein
LLGIQIERADQLRAPLVQQRLAVTKTSAGRLRAARIAQPMTVFPSRAG